MVIVVLGQINEIELALTRRFLNRGRSRFNVLLIFGHVNVFAWPMRPLAKMARHIPPGEITLLPFHWNARTLRKADAGYTDSAALLTS